MTTLERIAKALGVSLAELFSSTEELQPNAISNNRPFSIYIRKANNDEGVDTVEVEAYLSFWRLRYNGKSIKLDALVLSKHIHDSDQEWNDDVNHHSLINLQKAFDELQISLRLI